MRATRKPQGALLGVVGLSATLFAACGGSGGTPTATCPAGTTGTPPSCVAIPPPCTQDLVEDGAGSAASRTLYFNDFSVPDSGRLDITVDWTFPSSPIGVYVVPANTCDSIADFNARNCNFLVRSEPSTQKPRKISTPNFAAGNYRWLMGTYGDDDESLSYQFVLSKGTSCPVLGGTSPQAAARDLALPALFERMLRR